MTFKELAKDLLAAALTVAVVAGAARAGSVGDKLDAVAEALTVAKPKMVWTMQQFRNDQTQAMMYFLNNLPDDAAPYIVVTSCGVNGWTAVVYRVRKGDGR